MITRQCVLASLVALGVAGYSGAFAAAAPGEPARLILTQTAEGYMSDTAITAKVKSALLADQSTSGLAIQVETEKGVVQLSGFVDSAMEKEKAADIARGVEGVKDVKNDIRVGGKETP
ncbi:uncharacterized protein sS8_1287 [Methylocaldum marinum]|uniref:Osmotically-inducible protein Y n=1 Tax=Methylocaldum marinum TaxID=1432792 RepID=A0A250KNV1_9GAMM|nr:BON domain-containing protein [Methylocaldum marinum]BBA33247.1 uncharacterized protein sS8_1287 [Methylocaldum marinum]